MQNLQIRFGGVPEHFNYPWVSWINNKRSQIEGITATWKDFPGGSGAMIGSLEVGEIDVALVLTEAVVHAQNRKATIVPLSLFVESPLVWGIFSGAQNEISEVDPGSGARYAISRFGSGSHLMAQVDASMRNGHINEDQWVVVQSLSKAKQVLSEGGADLFFWEKWMTKPLVDSGILKMIDERPTPWSCFTMVCTEEFAKTESNIIKLKAVFDRILANAQSFGKNPNNAEILSTEYNLKMEDAQTWLNHVCWVQQWTDPTLALIEAKSWLNKLKTS